MTRAKPHMLIVRTLNNTSMELQERACLLAFQRGAATVKHFDLLLLMMNLLLVAGQTDKKRRHALTYAETTIKPVMESIKGRYQKTGKFGVNGEELARLKEFIEWNREFWKRQPGEVFAFASEQVEAYYAELKARAA